MLLTPSEWNGCISTRSVVKFIMTSSFLSNNAVIKTISFGGKKRKTS